MKTRVHLSASGIRAPQILLIVASLAVGLFVDVRTDIVGQTLVSIAVWAVLLYLLTLVERPERHVLITCLTIATAGEMFCSLVWGLYTYRLGNIPQFVPPGHVLMLLLGLSLARRMPEAVANGIIGCAAIYSLTAAATGFDMLAAPLFLLLITALLALPSQRRLYASTFVLSLGLELYGTWLGNWRWAHEVPALSLVTTNPPGLSGAFYCGLDALVAAVSLLVVPRFSQLAAQRIK